MRRLLVLLIVIVVIVATLAFTGSALAYTSGSLPGGTSIEVDNTEPVDGDVYSIPIGETTIDVIDIGNVSVGAGIPPIGSALLSLEMTVDGIPVPIDTIDTALPTEGPVTVNYSTTIYGLGAGEHDICVIAFASDAGGPGATTDCKTITVEGPPLIEVDKYWSYTDVHGKNLGTPLPMTDPTTGIDTYQIEAVVKKDGTVSNFNPGQFYAVSTVEVLTDLDELVINEIYWAIIGSGLGELNPNILNKDGGGCVVVYQMRGDKPVPILNAMDEEVVVQDDMATVTLEDVEAGDVYMVYVKFQAGLKGEQFMQIWATNISEAIGTVGSYSGSDMAQAAIRVIEKD